MRTSMMLLALCVSVACHPAREPDAPDPKPDQESGVATILVRGVDEGWTVEAAPILPLGNGGRLASMEWPSVEGRRERDHLEVECPRDSLCTVSLAHEDGTSRTFEVVSGAASTEVEISPLSAPGHEAVPRYLQPRSRSARVAALLVQAAALVPACHAAVEGECGGTLLLPDPQRVVPGHDPKAAVERLRAVLTAEDEALATWAYFDAGCPRAPIDAELARLALRGPIEPLARNLWPVGIARAIVAAEGRAGAQSRLRAMRAPAERELAAATMLALIYDARSRHELEQAVTLYAALRAGEGPWSGSPLREVLLAQASVVGAAVGSIPLRTLAGEPRDPADMIGAPLLVVVAASWCEECHRDGLPELRRLAAEHPELAVLYVLVDAAETAAGYVAAHAPIPGTVVRADDAAQAKLEVLLGAPAVPSFVVLDGNGRVAAIPGSDDLDTVVRRSGVLADR